MHLWASITWEQRFVRRVSTAVNRGVWYAGVSRSPKEQANPGNPSVGRQGKKLGHERF